MTEKEKMLAHQMYDANYNKERTMSASQPRSVLGV